MHAEQGANTRAGDAQLEYSYEGKTALSKSLGSGNSVSALAPSHPLGR